MRKDLSAEVLVCQISNKFECCSDIVTREVVLTLHFFEGHTASQAAYHNGDGQAGAADYRLAVADGGVKDGAVHEGPVVAQRLYP